MSPGLTLGPWFETNASMYMRFISVPLSGLRAFLSLTINKNKILTYFPPFNPSKVKYELSRPNPMSQKCDNGCTPIKFGFTSVQGLNR